MSIRIKLMLLLLVVGVIPMVIITLYGRNALRQVQSTALTTMNTASERLGAQNTQTTVNIITKQLHMYLESHPEIDINDSAAFINNREIHDLAIHTIGKTGYTMIYDDQLEILFHIDSGQVGHDLKQVQSRSATMWNYISLSLLNPRSEGFFFWSDVDGTQVKKYTSINQIGNTSLRLAAVIDAEDFHTPSLQAKTDFDRRASSINVFHILVGIFVGVLTITATLLLGREVTTGLILMSEDAIRITRTLPDPIPLPEKSDELAIMHNALTNAAMQVRNVRVNLEKQVNARTADLSRRSAQIEAVLKVAREAADVLDVKKMLTHTTELISESFAFYHTGIFLLDEAGEYAILQATNSEGGKRLLAKDHMLKVGESGIVGYVTSKGEPYLVNDVDFDTMHVKNVELARTRSELALPLKVRGKVIGVLDVQSTEPNAYTPDDIKILQILTDQVSLAMQNVRLLEESQKTLRELYHMYGENIRESWRQRLGQQPLAYAYNRLGVEPVEMKINGHQAIKNVTTISEGNVNKLIAPITIRGQSLGSISLNKDIDQGNWTPEDVAFLDEIATQIAPALENARLLEEIQRRAQIERQIGEISAKTQSSLDMETVLRTAIQEIGKALDAAKVQIRLGVIETAVSPSEEGEGADKT
jgi:GAF domain-containing protein